MTTPSSLDALCHQARMFIAERDWAAARNAYQEALSLKPDAADIHQGLATVCFQLRDLPMAAHHFREVTRLDPFRAGAYVNLGAVCNLLDQLDEAITALRRGIQLDSQRAEGYYNLGLVYRRKGQMDLAIHAYREALRVNPRMADTHYNLGNLYFDRKQYAQAIDHYQQALKIRPEWEKPLNALTSAREAQNQQEAPKPTIPEPEPTPVEAPRSPARTIDPHRMLDPEIHGLLLNALHKATIETDTHGKVFMELIEQTIEPAIKDLSASLINPEKSNHSLETCIKRFEEAMTRLMEARDGLQTNVGKVRLVGDKLVAQASD